MLIRVLPLEIWSRRFKWLKARVLTPGSYVNVEADEMDEHFISVLSPPYQMTFPDGEGANR